jgi:hypothetical protein
VSLPVGLSSTHRIAKRLLAGPRVPFKRVCCKTDLGNSWSWVVSLFETAMADCAQDAQISSPSKLGLREIASDSAIFIKTL